MKKNEWDKLDVAIEHDGRAIVLPGDPGKMPLDKAVEALQRKIAAENQEYAFYEVFPEAPHDAAVAFVRAMNKLYGFSLAQTETIKTFFGEMRRPPVMMPVKVGPGDAEVILCPIGQFKLPGVDSIVQSGMQDHKHKSTENPRMTFFIHSEAKKKDSAVLQELATETRRLLKEQSIYRGKPIRIAVDDEGALDMESQPEFLDVSEISEADVLFDADIKLAVETNILVPVRHTDTCLKHKIPLKRGVLVHGKYGVGKSLLARMVARVCELNQWTFILLDRVQGLREALEFANRYAPAVVFAEDIDRIAEERDEATNDLINTIDGVVSKRSQIMTILTTNHVEKLNPVIIRPGRLDAVIELRPPSAETAERLIRHYAGKLLPESAILTEAGTELQGQIPASIRECVERAKLGMIGREATSLTDSDLVVAAQTMKNHLALLNRENNKEPTAAEKLAEGLHAVVGNGTDATLKRIEQQVDEIRENM